MVYKPSFVSQLVCVNFLQTSNDVLAEQADAWAVQCIYDHGFPATDNLPYNESVGMLS